MSKQRFETGRWFTWQSEVYEVKRLLPGSLVEIENLQRTTHQTIPFAQLAQALFSGSLRLVEQKPGQPRRLQEENLPTLADYPERLRKMAEYRLEVIRPLISVDKRTRQVVADRVAEVKRTQPANLPEGDRAVSVTSVYRWLKDYTQSGHDLRVLIGDAQRQGAKNRGRLGEAVETLIQKVIEDRYLVREHTTGQDVYLEVLLRVEEENRQRSAHEFLKSPSMTTIWRRIAARDTQEKLEARHGKRLAQQRTSQYGQIAYPSTPLERVEIDHTRLDLVVVDAEDDLPIGRPTLTYCLDTATRYPLGFYVGFEPPSYLTVMQCLHQAILPKEAVREKYGTQHDWLAFGVPAVLIVDNGKEFVGQDLRDACFSLGIELDQMPLQTPHFKAAVERMFETLNTGLVHTLPGTTFSNIDQKGDYDSQLMACMDLQDLNKVFHIFLLDVYAENFHRGLDDIPARCWERAVQNGFFPRLPGSSEELKVLLGRMAYRNVSPHGIQLFGLFYNAPELSKLRLELKGEKTRVKYDPADLGKLFVFDPVNNIYLEARALEQEYANGLSLWKHRVIRNLARQQKEQVDGLALARAKRQIQEIVQKHKADRKTRNRTRVARWNNDKSPETTSSLPAASPSPFETSQKDLVVIEDMSLLELQGWSADYDLPKSSHHAE